MQKPTNLKKGDMFRVIEESRFNDAGEIITLKKDDGGSNPFFWNADKSDYHYIYFSCLEPYPKTIRDARFGDVVIGKTSGYEYLVLERGQSTVLLSQGDSFNIAQNNFHFDQLEKYYTLKSEPEVEVVDDKTAEAMKLLKEAGYKISK